MTDPAGYSLTVPDGWTVSEHFGTGAAIRADLTGGDDMGLQVRLADVKPSGFLSTAEYMIADYAGDMTARRGGSCDETERIDPGVGYRSVTARFRGRWQDGGDWYLQLSLVGSESMLVILQCGCPWEERQRGREIFDGVVGSIAFAE